jgi:hypothetical protein
VFKHKFLFRFQRFILNYLQTLGQNMLSIIISYGLFGISSSSGILNTRKHNASTSGSVSVVKSKKEDSCSVRSLRSGFQTWCFLEQCRILGCCVALVRTDVSEELIASIIRVTRIGEVGTLAVTNN